MMFYKSTTISMYLASKLVEVSTGFMHEKFPQIQKTLLLLPVTALVASKNKPLPKQALGLAKY